ncbi:MAG: polyketide synthase dehydratase domain-containing protein, partial [Planctomycetales bacterium]|nr:polyketide synthase dehydratase domain-containing protein [Planctomycetales bacterium]
MPSSIDSFPRILGGQDTLVLSAAMEQWEQRYGASHPRDGRLIDLGKRDLPPLLCWMRECYLSGLEIDWRAFYGSGFQWIDLPTYPFAKESHWFGESKSTRLLQFGSEPPDQHPYIGVRLRGPTIKETVFQNRLTPNHPRLLQDHKIYDMVVVPGAFHLAAVLAASREEGGDRIEMSDVMFPEALVLQEDVHRAYQLSFSMKESAESDFQTFRVFSELQGSDRWSLHCEG